jgi:hypothetical protein
MVRVKYQKNLSTPCLMPLFLEPIWLWMVGLKFYVARYLCLFPKTTLHVLHIADTYFKLLNNVIDNFVWKCKAEFYFIKNECILCYFLRLSILYFIIYEQHSGVLIEFLHIKRLVCGRTNIYTYMFVFRYGHILSMVI